MERYKVLASLRHTRHGAVTWTNEDSSKRWVRFAQSEDSYADARDLCLAQDWVLESVDDSAPFISSVTEHTKELPGSFPESWTCYQSMKTGRALVQGITTNLSKTVDFYTKATNAVTLSEWPGEFRSFGSPVTNGWARFDSVGPTVSGIVFSIQLTSTNQYVPLPPDPGITTVYGEYLNGTQWGFRVVDQEAVLRWRFTHCTNALAP